MRMRKVKWAVDYLNESRLLIPNPEALKGKWKQAMETDQLHIEIGCGKGKYSLEMAKKNPSIGFVAIEKNESAAGIAAKKMDDDLSKKKVHLICKDAADLTLWFAPGEINVIHLNFSDPWPKKRYAKRRLSAPSFLEQYKRVLVPGGQIQMKTDNAKLFEYSVLEFLKAGFKLDEFSVDYRAEPHDEDAITEYEAKFIENGQPIYRAVFVKETYENITQ